MRESISQAILEFLKKNPELSACFKIKCESQESLFTQQINFLNNLYEKNEEFKKLIAEQMPKMISLADITNRITSLSDAVPQSSQGQSVYFLQEKVDAAELANLINDDNFHLVAQVASQANANESQSPDNATVPEFYAYDRTQGPRAQMQDPILAFVRFQQIEHCDFLKNWKEKPEFNACFEYKNGYLHPKAEKEKEAADFIESNIDTLLVNADLTMPDYNNSQKLATQVLNFAMALGVYDHNFETREAISRTPEAMEHVKNAAMCLLKQQYLMTAHMAILRAREYPQKRIPVVFTLVGGGVFGNEKAWIAEAIKAAHLVIEKSALPNIDTIISCYSEDELLTMRLLLVGSKFSEAGTLKLPLVSLVKTENFSSANRIPENIAIAFYKQLYLLNKGSEDDANRIFNSGNIPKILHALEESAELNKTFRFILTAIEEKPLGDSDPFQISQAARAVTQSGGSSGLFSEPKAKIIKNPYRFADESGKTNYVIGVEKDANILSFHGMNAKGEYHCIEIDTDADVAISHKGVAQKLSSLTADPENGFSTMMCQMLQNRDTILQHFEIESLSPAPAP